MKKFKFSLDTVLAYKQQVQDALQGEHATLLAQVRAQEEVLEQTWATYRAFNKDYRTRKAEGMTISEALLCQNALRAQEMAIQKETDELERIRRLEEKKREEVIEARKDTSSLEKLREKKLDVYQKELQKSEENFVEEFVASRSVVNASA